MTKQEPQQVKVCWHIVFLDCSRNFATRNVKFSEAVEFVFNRDTAFDVSFFFSGGANDRVIDNTASRPIARDTKLKTMIEKVFPVSLSLFVKYKAITLNRMEMPN